MQKIEKFAFLIGVLAYLFYWFNLPTPPEYFNIKQLQPNNKGHNNANLSPCEDKAPAILTSANNVKHEGRKNTNLTQHQAETSTTITLNKPSLPEYSIATNQTNDEIERSIADVLVYGITDEQKYSFLEESNERIISNLEQEAHLIPAILNKIQTLEDSTYRNYLIALIGGLPLELRFPAIKQLLNAYRQLDQQAAAFLLQTLTKNDNDNLPHSLNEYLSELYENTNNKELRLDILRSFNFNNAVDEKIFQQLISQLYGQDEQVITNNLNIINHWLTRNTNVFSSSQKQQLSNELNYLSQDRKQIITIRISAIKTLMNLVE